MPEFNAIEFMDLLRKKDENVLKEYLQNIPSKIQQDPLNNLVTQLIQNKYWDTLDWCIDHNYIETDLFEYDDFNRTPIAVLLRPNLYTATDLADYKPHLAKYLAKIYDINEEVASHNLLSFALDNKSPIEILQTIIDTGIRMDFHTKYGETYLYQFCQQLRMPPPNTEAITQLLLDNGVDINATTIENKTALFLTLEAKNIPLTKMLLEAGADVNIADTKGITPFYIAAVYMQNPELVKLLLEYGTPDFTHLTTDKENLLNACLRYFQNGEKSMQVIALLLENGASLMATSEYYSKPKSGIDWVAEKPSELLSYLLDHKYIDVNEIDNDGNTILTKVCMIDCNYEEPVAKDIYRKVKLLLNSRADATIENRFDKKAVDYAMQDQLKTKIVELLLR